MRTLQESILSGRRSSIESAKDIAIEDMRKRLLHFLMSGLNPLFKYSISTMDYSIGMDQKGVYVDLNYGDDTILVYSGQLDLDDVSTMLKKRIDKWNTFHPDEEINFDFRFRYLNGGVAFDNCQNLTTLKGFYEKVNSISFTGFVGGKKRELDLHGLTVTVTSMGYREVYFRTDCDLTVKGPLNYKGFIDHTEYSAGVRHKLKLINIKNQIREI